MLQPLAELYRYGYDSGFYIHAFNHAREQSIVSSILGPWEGYSSVWFWIFSYLHLPAVPTLTISIYLGIIFTAVGTYYVARALGAGKLWAILGAGLVLVSLGQAGLATMFLWKQVIAGSFFIWLVYFFLKKKLWLVLLFSMLIFLTHKTTSFVIIPLLIYTLVIVSNKLRQPYLRTFFLMFAMLVGGYAVANYITNQAVVLEQQGSIIGSGLFLGQLNLMAMIFPILCCVVYGIKKIYQHNRAIVVYTCGISLWVFLGLAFSRRVFPFVSLLLIVFATVSWSELYKKGQKFFSVILFVPVALFMLGTTMVWLWTSNPLISREEIREIENFSTVHPKAFVVAATAEDGPWLLAFLRGPRLAAPGLFEDGATLADWQGGWSGQRLAELLIRFPRPLFVYQRDEIFPESATHSFFMPVSKNFFQVP